MIFCSLGTFPIATVQISLQWFLSLTVTAKFLNGLNVSCFEISFALFVLYQFIFTNIQGILHSETKFLAQLLHEWILLEFPMETLLLSATSWTFLHCHSAFLSSLLLLECLPEFWSQHGRIFPVLSTKRFDIPDTIQFQRHKNYMIMFLQHLLSS